MTNNVGHSLEKATAIDGWMSNVELEWLANCAKDKKAILEIGSYKGRSARAIADNFDGVLYCVDPWNGTYFDQHGKILGIDTGQFSEFVKNLTGTRATVYPIVDFFKNVNFDDQKFDLIFIDGDHRYEEVKIDILKAITLLKSDGILAGHDYGRDDWQGVKLAVTEIFGSEIEVIDTLWFVLPEKRL